MIYLLDDASKTDKTALTILIVIAVVLLILFAFIGWLIRKTMIYQGERSKQMMFYSTFAGEHKNSREYIKYGEKLSRRCFFKQSLLPIGIILASILIWLISRWILGNWNENIFNNFFSLRFSCLSCKEINIVY